MTLRVLRRVAAGLAVVCSVPTMLIAQTGYVTMSDSARLFYRVMGRGPDTIIVIHGGPGLDLESVAGDFAVLAAKHTVIFYDQRGGGKSTLPADTASLAFARQVQDLDELRQHFRVARVT